MILQIFKKRSKCSIVFLTLLILSVMTGAVFFWRDDLGRLAWQKYHNADWAITLDRNDANLAMEIGSYHFNGVIGGGKYDLEIAGKAYEKAVSINPQILWGHYQLARISFVKADFGKALTEINKELEGNPENLRSLYVRGLIYAYRGYPGDLEKSEMDFRNFTKWAPSEWAGYNDLAWILQKEKKYKEAEVAIQEAMKNTPNADKNPWLWNSSGVAKLNLKDYISAKSSFDRAKSLAGALSETEWAQSYPGNDPSIVADGLEAFRNAIEENINKTILNISRK
jgi:tetratricopeptide (TPR) repeat protein